VTKVLKLSTQINNFIRDYSAKYQEGILSVSYKEIEKAIDVLTTAFLSKSKVYVCGNGGSAAISDHFMCDHSKGIYCDTSFIPNVQSLSSNMSLITAIGNDISYNNIYSMQVDMFGQTGDVLVCISSSGNSPNIIEALKSAKNQGITTIALVGFDGGAAKDIADIVLHVQINNYGVVEDAHQSLMHIMAQVIRKNYTAKAELKL